MKDKKLKYIAHAIIVVAFMGDCLCHLLYG